MRRRPLLALRAHREGLRSPRASAPSGIQSQPGQGWLFHCPRNVGATNRGSMRGGTRTHRLRYNLFNMPGAVATIKARDAASFRRRLLRWFHKHQRKLPWRGESDPYRILVSEIMLQQTRVPDVANRHRKFIAQFPTAEGLVRARGQTELSPWGGLGDLRPAQALHLAAQEI